MGLYRAQSGELVEAVMQSEAKRPTLKAAKAAILSYLQREGWAVKPHLKVPHATSPDGELRLWFKAQAVYYSWGNSHSLNGARSLHTDIRDVTPEEFVKEADRLGRKWGKSSADDFQKRWGGQFESKWGRMQPYNHVTGLGNLEDAFRKAKDAKQLRWHLGRELSKIARAMEQYADEKKDEQLAKESGELRAFSKKVAGQ